MVSDPDVSILSAVPMPLVLIGGDERIRATNAAAEAFLNGARSERHYVTALRQPELLRCVEGVLKDGRPRRARYVDKTIAREATYRVQVAPVGGDPREGVLVSFEDVTEVEMAGEVRRDFVANVSHELKTPLTALLGFIETLRGAARDDPDARDRFLTIMEREAERMNRLVSDLLSLSRVESAERQRPTDPVELSGIVASTIESLSALADARDVTIELETDDADHVVPGDPDQIQQVITNLVENAIKYGSDGGRVTVRLARRIRELAFQGPGVMIQVEDDGEGFDPIHIPRLTERFYRVDNHRSREMGGTGLGLAIAKHIVNRHRGRFRIDSEPGDGATFTVLLPAIR